MSPAEQYLRSYYCVINIVCTVGSGDMFPCTDPERWFFSYMVMFGDCMFAVAFGLITNVALQISMKDEVKFFQEKIYEIKVFMQSFKLKQSGEHRIEQFYAFEF